MLADGAGALANQLTWNNPSSPTGYNVFSASQNLTSWLVVSPATFTTVAPYGWQVATPAAAVPEIDPAYGSSALSLVAGVLAMVEQRRRRVAASRA